MILLLILLALYNVIADPLPNGGQICNSSVDCNNDIGGFCKKDDKNGTIVNICVCFPQYGNPNCSYQRKSKDLAGGLQIGLSFVGVNGVGNFIIGDLSHAVPQLLMGLFSITSCCFSICIFACAISDHKGLASLFTALVFCIIFLVLLGGFGWSIADGALMIMGKKSDSNGYALY